MQNLLDHGVPDREALSGFADGPSRDCQAVTVYLERRDPQKHMARYYRLIVVQTLFGDRALITEWGRIGSPGRVGQHWFGSRKDAEAAQAVRAEKKIRRGYE